MRGGPYVDLILVRLLFVLAVAVTSYVIEPFGLSSKLDAGVGALVGLSILLFEWRLRRVTLHRGCVRKNSWNLRRLLIRAGDPKQRPCKPYPKLPTDTGHAAHGLRRF